MSNKKVVYGIAADNSIFKKKMKEVTDKFKGFEHTAKGVVGRFKKNWLGLTAAIGGIIAFVSKATRAYGIQQKAEHQLASALKTTGDYSKKTLKDLKDYASQLQKITTVGDETSLQLMQLGLSMGINQKNIKDATKNAIGLSKALGLDLRTSMKAVAEIQQGNFQTLSRYDRRIMSAKTNAEKMAIAQQDMANGFKLAQSETKTLSGRIEQMKNATGDAMEVIGGSFSDIIGALAIGINGLAVGFQKLPKIFHNLVPIVITGLIAMTVAVKLFGAELTVATGGISLAIGFLVTGAAWVATHWGITTKAFQIGIQSMVYGILWLSKKIVDVFGGAINDAIKRINFLIEATNKLVHTHFKKLAEVDFSKGITKSVDKAKAKLQELTDELKKQKEEESKKENKKMDISSSSQITGAENSEIEQYLENAKTELQIENEKYAKMQELAKGNAEKLKAIEEKHAQNIAEINKKKIKAQVQAAQTALGQIAGLMSESNRKLFNIGKAAAITNAIISGYEAVAKTMASVPFPFNIPLAAAQATASAIQVAKIASTQPPKAAKGALLESPTTLIAGEAGRELVLPNYLTERIINMTSPKSNATINFNINGTVIDDMALKSFTKKIMNQQETIIKNNEAY